MRTQQEIQDKLEQLQRSLPGFNDPMQVRKIQVAIACYRWVLGLGPEFLLVPKPIDHSHDLPLGAD
jgi:hypothetical protein